MTTEQRIDELEEAMMLLLVLSVGNTIDATVKETEAMQTRLGALMENFRRRQLLARPGPDPDLKGKP